MKNENNLEQSLRQIREYIEEIEPRGYKQAKKQRLLFAFDEISNALVKSGYLDSVGK